MEHVGGVHAQDSSIIYIPDEKVMFLGDCIYQDFYSGEWSYDLNELTVLLDKIKKYDVDYYVTGHQDPKTHAELWSWMDELIQIGEIVGEESSLDKAVARYNEVQKTLPSEEQLEYIQNFVSGNQKKLIRNEA
ncbi:hypothetical protein [Paenibacillus pini]|uniref:Metallo-beta-lactamase family protein n=1 Tax=Paenibacillus pini JCM 16418 TaxID=1236976 RepID=W7YKU9_9BACL|nr:hypothetical protein [Paenibacillus pini]GAF08323.1 metallo-beta-lactamase family protein [Paenibacillus pini JCM 16418]